MKEDKHACSIKSGYQSTSAKNPSNYFVLILINDSNLFLIVFYIFKGLYSLLSYYCSIKKYINKIVLGTLTLMVNYYVYRCRAWANFVGHPSFILLHILLRRLLRKHILRWVVPFNYTDNGNIFSCQISDLINGR